MWARSMFVDFLSLRIYISTNLLQRCELFQMCDELNQLHIKIMSPRTVKILLINKHWTPTNLISLYYYEDRYIKRPLCLKVAKLGTMDAPRQQMTPMDSEVTWSKVKVKLLILLFAQYFLPLFWKVPKLGSVDVPSEQMTYCNVQVTWSEVKLLIFVPCSVTQYLMIPLKVQFTCMLLSKKVNQVTDQGQALYSKSQKSNI